MKALDLTNQKFGKLTAITKAPKRGDRYTRWICKCDCGNIVEVRTDYLTSKHTTSCGCEKQKYFYSEDLIGKRFGKLVVLENLPHGLKKCQCDCGNTTVVKTYNLTNGNTQSCGCLKSKGELKINQLLTNMLISFKTQYSFPDCRFPQTNRLAYFDYAIFQNNALICLIEYDGAQHYHGWNFDDNDLQHIQEYDEIKNQYCRKHNIPLIRIPYWEIDNMNQDYLLNKIKEAQDLIEEDGE